MNSIHERLINYFRGDSSDGGEIECCGMEYKHYHKRNIIESVETFPPFESVFFCHKCLCHDFTMEHKAKFILMPPYQFPCYRKNCNVIQDDIRVVVFPEHIKKTCSRCGYSWCESTADAE